MKKCTILKLNFAFKTQRFLQEVTSDYVALTGLKMFSITRNFLLGVSDNKLKIIKSINLLLIVFLFIYRLLEQF